MKTSVIMPAYNRERYIGSALRSLLRQRMEADLDIIVIDDGSRDGTADVVRSFMREAPEIRLFQKPNGGVASARNAGLTRLLPETAFVSFLDSDDVSPARRFRQDLAILRTDSQLDLTYAQICELDLIDEESLEPAEGSTRHVLRAVQLGSGLYRRKLVESLGGFDEGFVMADDMDFLFRLFEVEPRCAFSDAIAVYYRRHPDNITTNRALMRREFMQACSKSAARRRLNPALADPYRPLNLDYRNAPGPA
ncbi:MAG: glycosyltransferase family 2 protein [Mesorhizobium sp.]|nr:glycosyltransferase family 2 protein [Mesorhizobium sp.]MBL8579471.1 glycosyltransferase family 2 protein [Mesorhizobium sp.]